MPTPPTPLALITGASAGIGEAIARELASRGFHLALAARSRDVLDRLAAELAANHGVKVHVFTSDLAAPDAAAKLVDQLAAAGLPNIDLLVNNAGFGLNERFWIGDRQRQLDMIQLNIASLTDLTHRLLPGMLNRRTGRILNVASIAGFTPGPYQAVYFATKAYVLSFSVALHEELRAAGAGVTVTALCPGPVPTKFADAAGLTDAKLLKGPAVLSAQAVAKIGVRAAMAGKPIAVAGFINTLTTWLTRLLPRWVAARLAASLQRPAAGTGVA